MASSSYLARVIYREANATASTKYKLLCRAKSIGSPMGTPNTIETTDLECDTQTYIEGIKTSDAIEVSANLSSTDFTAINALKGKTLDFIFLYGSDGLGGQLKVQRQGTVTATPNDVGGVDEVLEMTVTITPSTQADVITNTITTTDGVEFTVSSAS